MKKKGHSLSIPVSLMFRLPDKDSSLGSQIKYYRVLRRMTQEELGEAIGMTKHAIRHIENDEMLLVNLSLVDKLVSCLDIEDKIQYDDYIQFIKNNPAAQMKAYRKKKNITMYELSKLLNINYTTVKRWEGGKSVLSRESFKRLMELFNEG